jgi:hypothetical protein
MRPRGHGDAETRGKAIRLLDAEFGCGEPVTTSILYLTYLDNPPYDEDLTLMENIRSYKELRVYQAAITPFIGSCDLGGIN